MRKPGPKYKSKVGRKLGMLTIIEESPRVYRAKGSFYTPVIALCECGAKKSATFQSLQSGKVKDCGCVRESKLSRAHPVFSNEDKDLRDIKWRIHPHGYAQIGGGNSRQLAHRVVMTRVLGRELTAEDLVDHINRNKNDNRRGNLRIADMSINSINRDRRPDNTSGFTGVYKYTPKHNRFIRWYFIIQRRGHKTFFSRKIYSHPEDAHLARLEKLKEYPM